MDEKQSDAKKAFAEWWVKNWQGTTQPVVFDLAFKEVAQKAWFVADSAATERAWRRCVEICESKYLSHGIAANVCAAAIAKEFGLD